MTLQTIPAQVKPLGYQQLSAATLAAATHLSPPAGATMAVIVDAVSATAVRYRDDGTAPDATHGISVAGPNYPPLVYTGDLAAIQFILSTGAPILDILYYGNV